MPETVDTRTSRLCVAAGGVEVSVTIKTVNLIRHMLLLTDASSLFPPASLDYGSAAVELLFYGIGLPPRRAAPTPKRL